MKLLHHYASYNTFATKKVSSQADNAKYTIGPAGTTVTSGAPDVVWQAIVFIQDTLQIWTHGKLYHCVANPTKVSQLTNDAGYGKYTKPSNGIPKTDLHSDVQTSLNLADTAIQSDDLHSVATSGSYNDLKNKPSIPTQSTVSGWGFGTYSKPSGGIPKTDLANSVQASLTKADNAATDASLKATNTSLALTDSSLSGLTTRVTNIEGLINADNDAVINKFNEIVAFLNGIDNDKTLSGIISGISEQIAAKASQVSINGVKKTSSNGVIDLGNVAVKATINGAAKTVDASGNISLGNYATKITYNDTSASVNASGTIALGNITKTVKYNNGSAAVDASGIVSLGDIATKATLNGADITVTKTTGSSAGTLALGSLAKKITYNDTSASVNASGTIALGEITKSVKVNGTQYDSSKGIVSINGLAKSVSVDGSTASATTAGAVDLTTFVVSAIWVEG